MEVGNKITTAAFIVFKLGSGSGMNMKSGAININLVFTLIGALKNGQIVVKILYCGYYNKYYYFDNTC